MINPALEQSPEHLKLIGPMVVGYPELEITFAHIAGLVLKLRWEVLNAAEQVLSETAKIKLIHALARRAFDATELKDDYQFAYQAIFYCSEWRNKYAHSQWKREDDELWFAHGRDFFEGADPTGDDLPWIAVPLQFLQEQEAYFEGTRKWLIWLEYTLITRNKRLAALPKPSRMPRRPVPPSGPQPAPAQPKKSPGSPPSGGASA
jgi:hypothetical protein